MAARPFRVSNRFVLWLLVGLCPALALAEEVDESQALQWLERMNYSVANLSYEGRFVYLSGQSLEAMEIRHRIVDGRPRESLSTLTGNPREVIRDADTLTIVTQVNGKTRRIQQPSRGKLSPLKPLEADKLRNHYRIKMGKLARIAGRYGVAIHLAPGDDLRYGYRLILDRENALPLDLTVIDGRGQTVSRIMFTELEVTAEGARTLAASQGQGLARKVAAKVPSDEPGAEATASHWHFSRLPKGFQLISYQRLGGGRQEHFVFSDGLATVSAYIEPLAAGDKSFEGRARLGSINALGRRLEKAQLTVVGEVPQKTLELLATALEERH